MSEPVFKRDAFDANYRLGTEALWLHVNACGRAHIARAVERQQARIAALESALAEAQARPWECDACGGTGTPPSGIPCMCGGTGRATDAVVSLRAQLAEAQRERDDLCLQIRGHCALLTGRHEHTEHPGDCLGEVGQAFARLQRERDEARDHAEVGRLLEELRGKVSGGPIEMRVSTRKTAALVRVGRTPWYGDTLAAALRKAREGTDG